MRLIVGVVAVSIVAALLRQQAHVHGFLIALIREAEKIDFLRDPLLRNEQLVSDLLATALVVGCTLVWLITRRSPSMNRIIRAVWALMIAAVVFLAYYTDSRIEVQFYEHSLHRAMYLTAVAASLALVATLSLSYRSKGRFRAGTRTSAGRWVAASCIALVVGALVFTFARFDSDHGLKTLAFYGTAHLKRNLELAQWALDGDRDGYSALLGGGDNSDRNPDINPGASEIVGDLLDNNCIGGDLTQEHLGGWRNENSLQGSIPVASNRRFNVVFLFIDTLRPDHMSLYGYERQTTPNLDRLAARSSVFENAYAPSPDTFGSLPRFMQSAYWDGHFETWTEVLARNGYNGLLFPRRLSLILRHLKGMSVVEEANVQTFEETIDVAIDVLSKTDRDRPFCAFLYSFDPHFPYDRHSEFDFGPMPVDGYDSEIAYADHHFGRLLDWMERDKRFNDTMIIVMSDHGESLGERGIYRHGLHLYDDQMRVPLIIYVPELEPRRIDDYVSTVDLGSTILNAVGLEHPREYVGVSLLPLMRGAPVTHPPIYGEHVLGEASPYVRLAQNVNPETRIYMVITQDGLKMIYNWSHYAFELYDLKNDRYEQRNLYDSLPEKAGQMKRLLGRFVDVTQVSRPWDADDSKHSVGRELKQRSAYE